MYHYYIAYQFNKGYASCHATRENKLNNFKEMKDLVDAITQDLQKEDSTAKNVIILNAMLLE